MKGYIVENIAFYQNNKYVATIKKIIISFTGTSLSKILLYNLITGSHPSLDKSITLYLYPAEFNFFVEKKQMYVYLQLHTH